MYKLSNPLVIIIIILIHGESSHNARIEAVFKLKLTMGLKGKCSLAKTDNVCWTLEQQQPLSVLFLPTWIPEIDLASNGINSSETITWIMIQSSFVFGNWMLVHLLRHFHCLIKQSCQSRLLTYSHKPECQGPPRTSCAMLFCRCSASWLKHANVPNVPNWLYQWFPNCVPPH
jgi:hypothetical protein